MCTTYGHYTDAIDTFKEGGTNAAIEFWSDGPNLSINFIMEANLKVAMVVTDVVKQVLCAKKAANDYLCAYSEVKAVQDPNDAAKVKYQFELAAYKKAS